MIDTDKLANQIHAEVFDVAKTGFPLNVFPDVFQKIIFELVNYENFNLEYTATIMLSAFACFLALIYAVFGLHRLDILLASRFERQLNFHLSHRLFVQSSNYQARTLA